MKYSPLLAKKVLAPGARLLYKLFRYVLLIGISYVVLYPILQLAMGAFKSPEEHYVGSSGFLPTDPTFENFTHSQSYFPYLKFASSTALIAVISTVLQLVSCSLVGYGLGRYSFKGNAIVYACVLFTIILPVQTALIPLVYEYRWFDLFGIGRLIGLFTGKTVTVNLLRHYLGFYVPALFAVGLNSGIYIFLFRQFFASMPRDLEEAGKLDGCSPFGIYLRIMVPNIIPVVVTVTLLSLIYYWNDYTLASVLAHKDDGITLMVGLYRITEYQSSDMLGNEMMDAMTYTSEKYSIMLSIVAPLILLFMIGQKFFVECMDRSGSKG